MSTIQDIRALEVSINDIVTDYINGMYLEDDVLAISRRAGKLELTADKRESIKAGKETEIYPLKDLVRTGDDGQQEEDIDKISEIANNWIFLD